VALGRGYALTVSLRVLSPAPRDVWNELIDADPRALVSHTPRWTDIVCAVTGARDVSRLYEFGDGTRLVLPLVRATRSPYPLEASFPAAWGFGGVIGAEPSAQQLREVVEDLRSRPLVRTRVRPNPLSGSIWREGASRGTTTIARRAHVLDIRDGFDAVWRHGFSKGARSAVRRAERLGVDVELDTSGRLGAVFRTLYDRSVERWARRQHEPLQLARWRARRREPLEKFTELPRRLGSAGRLWVAWTDGRPAAAIFVLQGRNAHYTRGAMDEELAGRTRASYLLQSLAIEDACRAGCRWYHMGESGLSRGLAQFKEALGGRPVDYSEYLLERLPVNRFDSGTRTIAKRALRFRDEG
jgi:Acetyltransferase (GNAT) domain